MATTTPNFGWPVPTSTDLVKDGATAIEALGDGIDTSMVDLKGGLTGQVLSKTTNADMDFTWVTTDDANAIQNSIVDAKGDLISASANDTPARLAVGANGETLVADSSTSTGLRYQVPVNVNPILNSAMQIWQRGTSINAAAMNTYTTDRWVAGRSGNAFTVSRQATADTTNLPFIQYCARVQRDSGNANTSNGFFLQNIESVNSIPFAGKTITWSFYARAGANYSATSNALGVTLTTGTGTDQSAFVTISGSNNVINTTATLTTTWQRFTYTVAIASTVTQLFPTFAFAPTGTAGANDYYEITGVQIEIGSVATPFKTNGATIQGELAACQRYYWRIGNQTGANTNSPAGWGVAYSTTKTETVVTYPVVMRVAPTSVDFSNMRISDGVAAPTVSAITNGSNSSTTAAVLDCTSTGLTQYRPYYLLGNTGYLGFNAEL